MDEQQADQLKERGYLIFREKLPRVDVEACLEMLEMLWLREGSRAGEENYFEPGVRRLANLANKGALFLRLSMDQQVLEAVETVIGPDIRISMVNGRDVPPHSGTRMPFHTDTDKETPAQLEGYLAATALWMLDPFTVENGATAVVPGSHRIQGQPNQALADTFASHPDEIIIEGQPGDVLVFNGHCWHAGRPNGTAHHRRALLVHYLRADVPRPENRRQHLDPPAARSLSAAERRLLGIDD